MDGSLTEAMSPRNERSNMNEVKNGMAVWFFDSYGKQHNALVTCVHGEVYATRYDPESKRHITVDGFPEDAEIHYPSINLVHVSDNPEKSDSYGQQIERPTSVVYGDDQSARGMYWTFVQ